MQWSRIKNSMGFEMYSDSQIFQKVNGHFEKFLEERPALRIFLTELTKHGDILLFGGAVRDILAHKSPRDYDFVVTLRSSLLDGIVAAYDFCKNRFGGYKFALDGLKIDVWALNDTWAFRNKLLSSAPENLTETVFLNIDSIAINLCQGNVYAKRYREAMQNNLLDIVLAKHPFPELCVLRTLVYKSTYNVNISSNLKDFIVKWKHSVDAPFDRLCDIQEKGHGEKSLSRDEIVRQLSSV
jgi:hypothetical protein